MCHHVQSHEFIRDVNAHIPYPNAYYLFFPARYDIQIEIALSLQFDSKKLNSEFTDIIPYDIYFPEKNLNY